MGTTRSRSRDGRVYNSGCTHTHYDPSTGKTTGPFSTFPVTGWSGTVETFADNPHPGFKRRLRLGEVILGEMNLSRYTRSYSECLLQQGPWGVNSPVGPPGSWNKMVGDACMAATAVATIASPISGDLEKMRDVALCKAFAKANESALLVGAMVHEMDQTLSMLHRPLGGSRSLLKKILTKKMRLVASGLTSAKAAADAWLEYRYGWKPLIMDMSNIVQEVHRIRDPKSKEFLVARAGVSQTFRQVKTFTQQRMSQGSSWGFTADAQLYQTVDANAGVIYSLNNQTTSEEILKSSGLRARDLPSTLWEIMPWSFVIDWFVNVGSWLQAILPNPAISVEGTWVTTKDIAEYSLTNGSLLNWGSYPGTSMLTGTLGDCAISSTNINRQINRPLTNLPVLLVKPLSTTHAIDGVALSVQQVLKSAKSVFR